MKLESEVRKVSEPGNLVPIAFLVGNICMRLHRKVLDCLDMYETLMTSSKLA